MNGKTFSIICSDWCVVLDCFWNILVICMRNDSGRMFFARSTCRSCQAAHRPPWSQLAKRARARRLKALHLRYGLRAGAVQRIGQQQSRVQWGWHQRHCLAHRRTAAAQWRRHRALYGPGSVGGLFESPGQCGRAAASRHVRFWTDPLGIDHPLCGYLSRWGFKFQWNPREKMTGLIISTRRNDTDSLIHSIN